MVLPGFIWFVLFSYIPMFGMVLAFKKFRFFKGGFITSVLKSEWVGFDNFKFLFTSQDAWLITRNTIFYNLVFIILGLIFSVSIAIALNEMLNKKTAKVFQTLMLLPHFLSWVVVSYFVFSFLSTDKGLLNLFLSSFGIERISWYMEPKYWPYILTFMNIWKSTGLSTVIYLAAIVGLDKTCYEAAMIEGASKWQQIKYITIPHIKPMMIILTILAIGRIFRADFGLFYQVPLNSGPLYSVTNVIDTYVYRGLMYSGDIGMTTAVGLYQSVIGLILILTSNYIIKRIDSENTLL
ncbi:MAG: ABC transporter permease subunit [Spirochaetes bacterium]|nr:ABC transporter permease subunit [Spirochaetota bacterium]